MGNKKKSHGARSGKGVGKNSDGMFGQKFTSFEGWSVVMIEKPVTTPPQFWLFSSDGIPQTSQNFNVAGLVHCGAFRKLHLVDNSTSLKIKTVSSTLILDRTWQAFLGLGDLLLVHCEDWTFVSTS